MGQSAFQLSINTFLRISLSFSQRRIQIKMSGLTVSQIIVLAVACSAWARPQPVAQQDAFSGVAASALSDISKVLGEGVKITGNGNVATRSALGGVDRSWFHPSADSAGIGGRPQYPYDNAFIDQVVFPHHPTLNGEIVNPNYYSYQRQNLQPSSSSSSSSSSSATFDDINRALNARVQSANFPRSGLSSRSGVASRSQSATNFGESVASRSAGSTSASELTVSNSE